MDNFTVTLDIDGGVGSWPKIREIRRLGKNAEEKFWQRFREQAKRGDGEFPEDINKIHAKIRKELPEPLKKELVGKLRIYLGVPVAAPEPPQQDESSPAADTNAKRQEIQRTLETLEIHVKAIRGGSLEILLFALGAAKLISLTGISPDEFAKCLEIVTPIAMNVIFGTNVSLAAEAKPSPDVPPGDVSSGTNGAATRLPAVHNPPGVSYFIPALFGLVVFGSAIWVFATISAEIAKERAAIAEKLSTLLSTHDTILAEERKDFIRKSTELLAALTKSQVDKDIAIATAQKTLFDAELEFARRIDGASQARETAVIDFVKSRLTPDTKPKSSPGTTVTTTCERATAMRWVQLALRARGLYAGEIDGVIGPRTEDGLMKFQIRTSLPPTGTADSATLEKLGVHCETASLE